MGDVIEVNFRSEKYAEGPAHCLGCAHRWDAVVPYGTEILECPSCGGEEGIFTGLFAPAEKVWECGCGNQLFYYTEKGALFCPTCGAEQAF